MAHELGVKVCIGTETPLVIPGNSEKTYGINRYDQVVSELYRGMFTRIMKTMPIDYYWLWTPENWTWHGVDDADVRKPNRISGSPGRPCRRQGAFPAGNLRMGPWPSQRPDGIRQGLASGYTLQLH